MTILYDRGLLLVKTEVTFDVDPTPDQTNDSFLVQDPQFNPDINSLERNNVRVSLSNDPIITGRKLGVVTFQHEVRNNGNTLGTTPPRLGTLLKACKMGETQIETANKTVGPAVAATANTGDLAFTGGTTAYAGTHRRKLTITITTGGASGVAIATITSPAISDVKRVDMTGTADVILTDGVEIAVVDADGTIVNITPEFQSNNPDTNDVYTVELTPLGYVYRPISDNDDSVTIYLYFPDDSGGGLSLLHKLTGARGTWSVENTGGGFGLFTFTFTGSYQTIVDVAFPTSPTYETQKPVQVEQAGLSVDDGGFVGTLCASAWNIDIGNDVQPRECVNEPNSYKGSLVVNRVPVMGFDPEAVLEATHPFWANLAAATEIVFSAKVGTVKGNVVIFHAPKIQYSNLGYANRNNTRVYEVSASLAANTAAGNDELEVIFA